jgi:hypothetical protein
MKLSSLKILSSALLCSTLTACGLVDGSASMAKEGGYGCAHTADCTAPPEQDGSTASIEGPATNVVPGAVCGPGSNPQPPGGEANTSTEYWCNLERVSQLLNEGGGNWGFAAYENCAYWTTPPEPAGATGVAVADVSDSAHPVQVDSLETAAMMDPHESLKLNEVRGLLAAVQSGYGPSAEHEGFDVYDVSADCARPVLKASAVLPGAWGHEGGWTPDGLTYYGTFFPGVYAIDTEDPTNPVLLHNIQWSAHGLSFSDDGRRAYLANFEADAVGTVPEGVVFWGTSGVGPGNNASYPNVIAGLVILDVGEIQDRKPNPRTRVISELYAADASAAQMTIPVTIRSKPYVITVAEITGGVRIIDISDEAHPRTVSQIWHNPYVNTDGSVGVARQTTHYCGVDQTHEPTALACGNLQGGTDGIRVYDIRDPVSPKEIAYFNPQDACTGSITFKRERGELWTMCKAKGLQILRFTNNAWPLQS